MAEQDKYIAKKYSLRMLKQGVFNGEFLNINGDEVYRVRSIGTIIVKFLSDDGNYGFLVLDDGTSTIRIKAWQDNVTKIKFYDIGDLVEVFAGVQEYEGEVYLSPIIIRKIYNPNWELVRKIELHKKESNITKVEDKDNIEETKTKSVNSGNFLELIKKLDDGQGADMNDIINKSKLSRQEVVTILMDLMDNGDVYEPEPKKYKVLD